MKATRVQIEEALRKPDAATRFILLHGPDESGSRALVKVLAGALGSNAEKTDLATSELKQDPARLADEAASISMFGDARYIVVEGAGDEVVAAVEALVEAPSAGNPVLIVAGALKPTSKLLKLALAAPCALSFASYVPDGREAERLVIDMAHLVGLAMQPAVARRIVESTAGNRALIEQELAKFALFLDAAPDSPRTVDEDVIDAIGAASEEGDLGRLVDSVGGGDAATLKAELLRLSSQGVEGIPLVRATSRRMLLLARLRAEVERGNNVDAVMTAQGKSIFWKEKDGVARQLTRWPSALIAKAVARLLEAERQVKATGSLGTVGVDEELFAICRQAARLR